MSPSLHGTTTKTTPAKTVDNEAPSQPTPTTKSDFTGVYINYRCNHTRYLKYRLQRPLTSFLHPIECRKLLRVLLLPINHPTGVDVVVLLRRRYRWNYRKIVVLYNHRILKRILGRYVSNILLACA
jgi:hypothetical protein